MTTLDRHLLEKLENPKIPKSTTSFYKHHLLWCSSCFSHKRAEWDSTRFSLRAFIICGPWRSLSLSSIGRPQDPIAVLPSLILVAGVWGPPCCIPPALLWKKKEKRSEFNLRGCSSCGGRAPIRQSDPLPMAGGRAPRKIQIQNICPCAPSKIQI